MRGVERKIWGGKRESNPQPSEPQSGALPVELFPPLRFIIATSMLAPGMIEPTRRGDLRISIQSRSGNPIRSRDYGLISNTVPQGEEPPLSVVPWRFQAASRS